MSDIKDLPGVTLTRREVEWVWYLLPAHVKSGRRRHENPLFKKLGEVADPYGAGAPVKADKWRDDVIVRAFDAKYPINLIATEFGVSRQRVCQILERNGRSPKQRGRIAVRRSAPEPQPSWLTPEWRKEFEEELQKAGVFTEVPR